MENKAYFFRDVENQKVLNKKTESAIKKGSRKQGFLIFDTIMLEDKEFKAFNCNYIKSYDFISPYRTMLNMNENYEYVCIAVTSNMDNAVILLNTSGYSYARNVAIIYKN